MPPASCSRDKTHSLDFLHIHDHRICAHGIHGCCAWFILKWLSAGIWWQPYDDAGASAAQRPHCLIICPVSKFTQVLSQLICRRLSQTSDHFTSNYFAGSTNGSCTFVYMGWVLISEHFLCFIKTDTKAKTKKMCDWSSVTQTFYGSCSNGFLYDSLPWSTG